MQCEIEYLRSRRVLPADETHVLDEFHALTAWCGNFLTEQGISSTVSYYSKLSFLRDVIRHLPRRVGDQSAESGLDARRWMVVPAAHHARRNGLRARLQIN